MYRPDRCSRCLLYELSRINAQDTAALERHVASLLASIGRDPAAVPRESIRSFAKHCRHMKVVR